MTSEAVNLNFGLKMCQNTGFLRFKTTWKYKWFNFYIKAPLLRKFFNIDDFKESEAAGGRQQQDIEVVMKKIMCHIFYVVFWDGKFKYRV